MGSPPTDVPKSTPGHGGKREGAGRKPTTGSGRGGARPGSGPKPKNEQNDAYTVLAKAKAKHETYKAQLAQLEYERKAGDLVPIADFERALSDAIKVVAVTLESLPDVLERDANIDGPAVARAQQVIDRLRDDLYRRLSARSGVAA